jgi:hypothetical protein
MDPPEIALAALAEKHLPLSSRPTTAVAARRDKVGRLLEE